MGTEFGAEVGANGDTTSHVFRGSVRVQVLGENGLPDEGPEKELVLRADESAKVEKVGSVRETHQGQPATEVVRFTHPTTPPTFARRMRDPPKQLDLLDIVAGGNGTGSRRERGIDPSSGKEDPIFLKVQRHDDGTFHLQDRRPLIDGVFVPGSGKAGVQLDSAGHIFNGLKPTTGTTVSGIWARSADVSSTNRRGDRWHWVHTMADEEKFMPGRRGLLCMHANSGITFNLAAMRKYHEGARPARFRATAGLADAALVMPDHNPKGLADLWVFVDGELMLKRQGVRPKDPLIDVNIEIGSGDRFLTLVVSDGNGFAKFDWGVFGDPVLDMERVNLEDN